MIIKVVLEKYLAFSSGVLDYQVPDFLSAEIAVGKLVRVPFQKMTYNALVVALYDESEQSSKLDLKLVEAILNPEVLLTEENILIAQEIADYYLCSIAKVLHLFLPNNFWKNNFHKPKKIIYYLNQSILSEVQIRGKNQLFLLETFKNQNALELDELKGIKGFSQTALKSLIAKEIILVKKGEIKKNKLKTETDNLKNLNLEQKEAYKKILAEQKTVLLHGITGSGKTEVYLHLIYSALEKNQSALVLVPEIALTPQLFYYFQKVFGKAVGIIHSKLSAGEKEKLWWEIREQQKKVIIGSRSALFYPYQDLGVIVMDEAHEWTYKSDQTPRYHAKEVAQIMARYHQAKLVLGTATPSVEDYFLAQAGKMALIELKERIYEDEIEELKVTAYSSLPEIKIVDLKEEREKKNYSDFSDLLIQKLKQVLVNQEQAILFLNKRGVASSFVCRECGFFRKCKACEVSLTYHQKGQKGKLICHYCGRMEDPDYLCPHCQSPQLKFVGSGTQNVERELKKLFPQAKIARLDRDTTSTKDAYSEIYAKLVQNEVDILIGTQILAKGFDLPKVSLVGVLNADVGLNIPDFRSGEKIFQVLTQVAGRSGRRAKKGLVILQTYHPENFILQSIQKHDYKLFYQHEIKIREELNWPPYSEVIKLTYVDYSLQKVLQEVDKLKKHLNPLTEKMQLQMLSAPALIPKMHNKYHWNIILKGKNPYQIFQKIKIPYGWRVDRDPIQIS